MRTRYLLLCLLLMLSAGCQVDPVNSQGASTATTSPPPTPSTVPTATALPTATITASPTPSSTATGTPTATALPTVTPTPGPAAQYPRFILIDQDRQTMYVYEDGVEIRRIPVSTGLPDQDLTITPAWEGEVGRYVGTFFAFGTWADEAWYLFYHHGSILIHSAPYLKENGAKVYQELDALGVRPASHGCIRLPPEEATWFTEWQPKGAHVIILPLTPQP